MTLDMTAQEARAAQLNVRLLKWKLSDNPRTEFMPQWFRLLVLWFLGSSAIGWIVGSYIGHGGVVFLFGAWLLGAIGWYLQVLILVYKRSRQLSNPAVDGDAPDAARPSPPR